MKGCKLKPAHSSSVAGLWSKLRMDRQVPLSIFCDDRRGTSLVIYTLVLPMLLLIIFGAASVWRVISIKQSMDFATYEATRYLSRVGRELGGIPGTYYDVDLWEREARERVESWMEEQIRRNPLISEEDVITIDIQGPVYPDCTRWSPTRHSRTLGDIRFTVTTSLTLNAPLQIPFLGSWTLTLQERHSDHVECTRYFRDPPDEGTIF